ncbi:MAG: DUF2309 domain-containing protein [Reichenbachiella sp.]|uniref:YbcC family protein n=1 Tax=Reichenbachiella sp. TaxID=2184521 RepID=UPI003264464C
MKNQNLTQTITEACKKIAPAWPLKNFVAVNPYLGLTNMPFGRAAKILSERSSISMTMPIPFYLDQLDRGQIIHADISAALNKNHNYYLSPEEFVKETRFLADSNSDGEGFRVLTLLDIAEEISYKQWSDFMVDKISSWASSYFDEYQAAWNTTETKENLYQSWKADAAVDLSPGLMGLKNFRSTVAQMPEDAAEATALILQKLEVPADLHEVYLHSLLLKLNGWSSYISGKDWNNTLYGGEANNLQSFLSILLTWEYCLYEQYQSENIQPIWDKHKRKIQSHESMGYTNEYLETKLILQDAFDFASQRQLKAQFDHHFVPQEKDKRPKAQAVFCIDVRSEVYRRSLETVDTEIETLGFAGFFGFPVNYVPLAHSHGKNQCPVLIPSGPLVKETLGESSQVEAARKSRVVKHQVEKTWKKFKSGAISSFGYVSPVGLTYFPKLISDSFGWTRPTSDPKEDGLGKWLKKGRELDLSHIGLEDKISMAASALTAMGLKDHMAPLILITGHGSTSVNNPHATGLDCGACGGHSGEINAMTAERILNDPQVRQGLLEQGIEIPDDTHFIACLHDTTTDQLHIIGASNVPAAHKEALSGIEESLSQASELARQERARRLNINDTDIKASILKRSRDWSQVRPEWGLAGCSSFVIAPRKRTVGMDLGGKAFLHSYRWQSDEGFKILESIMSAPMVVTSWINLQYYASTTDNVHFGAGNKTLHNVTGGIGVLEGSGGDLRIGLPLQSLHDGKNYQHLPQRLNVIIEAPIEAINSILAKNPGIKDLCDNSWINLLHLTEDGKIGKRYSRNLNWETLSLAEVEPEEELILV